MSSVRMWPGSMNTIIKQRPDVILNTLERQTKREAVVRKTAEHCGFLRAAPGRVVTAAAGGGRHGLSADVAVVCSQTWLASRRVRITSCCLRPRGAIASHRACDVSTGGVTSSALRVTFCIIVNVSQMLLHDSPEFRLLRAVSRVVLASVCKKCCVKK
jgi:hypothetical protein